MEGGARGADEVHYDAVLLLPGAGGPPSPHQHSIGPYTNESMIDI